MLNYMVSCKTRPFLFHISYIPRYELFPHKDSCIVTRPYGPLHTLLRWLARDGGPICVVSILNHLTTLSYYIVGYTHCYATLPEMESQCVLYLNYLTQLYCYISWWYPCYIVGYCVLPILYQLVTSCSDWHKQSSQRMIQNKACET